jgi:hypothetical protein
MPSLHELPIKVLKNMLETNGAATYGTRDQLVKRIESGQQGKKKPGPKGKNVANVVSNVKSKIEFFKTQRPRLVEAGMKDKKKQDEELERRWQKKQSSPTKTIVKEPKRKVDNVADNLVTLTWQLDPQQLKDLNFKLLRIDNDNSNGLKFVYTKDKANSGKAKVDSHTKAKANSKKANSKKTEDDEDDEDDDEQADDNEAEFWEEHVADRMKKKLSRSTMVAIMKDMDPEEKISGRSREDLADFAAHQFINESDDEDEDEDDDDDM